MQKMIIHTKSADETASYGAKIAKEIPNGGVLYLFGDLGSGKTTFTQGFAKELGIRRHIISPTFLLMRTYEIPKRGGKLYHIDLYRIGTEKEIEELGVLDLLRDPDNIMIIEWSERMGNLLPKKRRELHFTYIGDATRKIEEIQYD